MIYIALLFSFIFGFGVNPFPAQAQSDRAAVREPFRVRHWNLNPFYRAKGYAVGRVTSAVKKPPFEGYLGYMAKWIYSPLVAELRLGRSTTDVEEFDEECFRQGSEEAAQLEDSAERIEALETARRDCTRLVSPIYVRTETDALEQTILDSLAGDFVFVNYTDHKIIFATEVEKIINNVRPVESNLPIVRKSINRINSFPVSSWLNARRGVIDGYIVQAEVEGNLRESYLVKMQIGVGNEFRELNVTRTDLYDFIVRDCMLPNRRVRVSFLNVTGLAEFFPDLVRGYKTSLRIYRVEIIE